MHKDAVVGDGKMVTSEDVKQHLSLTLLESAGDQGGQEDLKRLEGVWRDRLQSWVPLGLNTRDD